ncbi:MAG: glycosyltransferase [Candidatus Accumulibacter phosphatis]|uniref:glycosyltransferase n=1 Tax=Candidatus Accumulibacter sp. ACC012 TaxID=2823332 RepID=UPI0025C11EF2|nr:glycosyltransferase [Candidatus Accumulibacter sp. ACC012]
MVEIVDLVNGDVADPPLGFLVCLRALLMLLKALSRGHGLWSLLRRHYGLSPKNAAGGWSVSLRSFVRAQGVAASLLGRLDGVRLVHAHDLFCGVVGAELSKCSGAELVYDAHEVEFHRNRRNSWLRTAFDVVVERSVLDRTRELRVVNAPIAALYEHVHDVPRERIRVVLNDHFVNRCRERSFDVPEPGRLALVYVGAGIRGRQLDRLASEAKRLGVPVHAFFIGELPELAIAAGWVIGPRDYESALVSLVAVHRCVMWCCVDDVCLSYRLALPNKFFQALAVGIPVVAADGSYLADLVRTHDLGFVFDGRDLEKVVRGIQSPDFADKLASVRRFRFGLTAGLLRI